jgi:D-lactate dehydrogenase
VQPLQRVSSSVSAVGAPDRAPDWVASGTPRSLRRDLVALLDDECVLTRPSDLVRYASDASPYRRFPQAVVLPRTEDDVAAVLSYARRAGRSVTMRGAGTSLNGQGQGDGILLDVRRHWRGVSVEDDGQAVRVRPGTTIGHVNRVLSRYHRRLGPDPASAEAATVGGVVANNSGGMRCGTWADSYSTLRSLTFVLPSGTTIDTADANARARFDREEPALASGLARMRNEIRADPELTDRIQRKFAIKNTMGYRLCAFLDDHEPLDIFRRLLVGSEGTLAFIADARFDTVPAPRRTAIAWAHFEGLEAATAPVTSLVAAGATAVELTVASALHVASRSIAGAPRDWSELPSDSAALLIEVAADEAAELEDLIQRARDALAPYPTLRPVDFARERHQIAMAWRVREGMYGLLGRLRPPGTALIVEDVCVPPEHMAGMAGDLQVLLDKHGFLTGVAGHASAGNLHFMLTPALGDPADEARYDAFMAELVDLVVDRYAGSLKAEHGTGLAMAPFLEREWGSDATALMWRIKELADPGGVLSPGVMLSHDAELHLRHLKSMPPSEPSVAACVECGFCEPACPSAALTATPRQRIVLRRELARQPRDSALSRALLEEYQYDGLQTCAVDGLCKLACPLGIDTGELTTELRARGSSRRADRLGLMLARRWSMAESAARLALRAAEKTGDAPLRAATRALRVVAGDEVVPLWPKAMPAGAAGRQPPTEREGAAAVYFPACINRIFGPDRGAPEADLATALTIVSSRAGKPVWIPPDVRGLCCGAPWKSKGYRAGHAHAVAAMATAMDRWTDGGKRPLVIDATSCTLALVEDVLPTMPADQRPRVYDSIAWCHDLLPTLQVHRRARRVAVHPPCASRHLGLAQPLEELAAALAEAVDVPISAACCGFAGDRGMLHPELPAAALADEASELAGIAHDGAVCSNRTCEMALSQATDKPFTSVVYLLERATREA